MEQMRLEQLQVRAPRRRQSLSWVWRELCFARVAWEHIRWRLLVLIMLLVVGGLLFQVFEPEKQHSLPKAMYFTWALIFGEPPEEFPRAPVLQGLFFIVPVVGLLVILEGLVDFALMLRDRRRHERSWCAIMAASLKDHIVLVGLGKLGYRSYQLLRRLGEPIVVLERQSDNRFLDEIRRDGTPVLIGDARRDTLLSEANVAAARSIILATNDDLANLEVALDARRMNPAIRPVLRMFDQNMADKIRDGFNIRIAMSQSAISTPAFVMAAIDESIISSMVIDNRLIVMQRWFVRRNGPLCGKSIAKAMRLYGVGIVERRRGDGPAQLMPLPNVRLEDGDQLIVQGTYEVLMELRQRDAELSTASIDQPVVPSLQGVRPA